MLETRKGRKSYRTMVSIANIISAEIGDLIAADVTQQELTRCLNKRCKTEATFNRYRASLSAAYQDGVRNGRIPVNVARLIKPKQETKGRLRFLSKEEYDRLCSIIQRDFPERLNEFIVSVKTGLRLSEQYTIERGQFHPKTKIIKLDTSRMAMADPYNSVPKLC